MRIFIILCLAMVTFGCGEERNQGEVEAAIQEKLDKKISEYTRITKDRCRRELMTSATRVADSILLAEAKLWTDTIERPNLPDKPLPPIPIEVPDSLQIEPFLMRDSL